MSKTAATVITLLVLAVIGLGTVIAYPLMSGKNSANEPGAPSTGGPTVVVPRSTNNTYNTTYMSTTTVLQVPSPYPGPMNRFVAYTNKGFAPNPLYVNRGDSVTFVNNSNRKLWIESVSGVPAFNEGTYIGSGASWTYAFGIAGTFVYDNHLSTSTTGTIVVQ
jgi:plastocyanin